MNIAPVQSKVEIDACQKAAISLSLLAGATIFALGLFWVQNALPRVVFYCTGSAIVAITILALTAKVYCTVPKPVAIPIIDTNTQVDSNLKIIFGYIEGLPIPALKKDIIYYGHTPSDYSKEELKEDFIIMQNRDPAKVEKMFVALQYHFGTKKSEVSSPFPATGIVNYHGNNCHFNVALQILTHTRYSDYALIRPLRTTDDRSLQLQPLLWMFIENMRLGIPPTASQVVQIFPLLELQLGEMSNPINTYGWLSLFAPYQYCLQLEENPATSTQSFLEMPTDSIVVMARPGHFLVYVETEKGQFSISDGVVTKIQKTKQEIANDPYYKPQPIFYRPETASVS